MIIRKRLSSEKGSIMVFILLVFMITSILAMSLLNTGIMESKSSRFANNLLQAQQGVDAAVEWGLESIFMELNQPENLEIYKLPLQLGCGNHSLSIGPQGCQAAIGNVTQIAEADTEPNQCVYGFTAFAEFQGSRRDVQVEATYCFSGGYEIVGEDGNPEFVPRSYLDRGQISSCQ